MSCSTPEAEYASAEVFAKLRWPDGRPTCPRCGGRRHYHLRSRPRVFECAGCRYQVSVTAGTAMHAVKVSLVAWLQALRLHAGGVSARRLARELGVTYETAFQLLHKVRFTLLDEFPQLVPDPDAVDLRRVGTSTLCLCRPWRLRTSMTTLVAIYWGGVWTFGAGFDERSERLFWAALAAYDCDARVVAARHAISAAGTLRRRHRAVSPRWIDRYFAERSSVEASYSAERVARGVMGAPVRAWRAVVPALPPPG